MGKNYSRVKRGMVFWFNSNIYGEQSEYTARNGRTYHSSIQGNNRPWLVTSNDEGNGTAPTCNIVPITLEDKNSIPVHVKFTYEGKLQTILVEQPRTVDIMALGEYIYTLDDEVMEKVEKAIVIQHRIRPTVTYSDFTLDTTMEHLKNIISSLISERVSAVQATMKNVIPVSEIEDTALHLGQMIEDLVKIPDASTTASNVPAVHSEPKEVHAVENPTKEVTSPKQQPEATKPTVKKEHLSQIEKFNMKVQKSQEMKQVISQAKPTKDVKSTRNKWTPESRRQYLEDCEKLSPQDIMKKYGFTSIQSVFQTKYACKNALNK